MMLYILAMALQAISVSGYQTLAMSAVARNSNFAKLQAGYLFPEIARRRNAYLATNPDAKIISLGIGDTTMPIPDHILDGLVKGASKLGTKTGYSGYGMHSLTVIIIVVYCNWDRIIRPSRP
jgi:hypothetical protein